MGRWVDGSRLFVSMIFSTYEIYISTVIPSHSHSPTCPTVFTVLGVCLKCLHEPLLAEELGGVVPSAMGYVQCSAGGQLGLIWDDDIWMAKNLSNLN